MPSINDYEFHPKLMLRMPAYYYEDYTMSLDELLNDWYFRAAIFLASRSLYEVLEKKNFNTCILSEKELLSLKMYVNRMCFRPTPFGLFSRFSMINWSCKSKSFINIANSTIHIDPDYFFLTTSFQKYCTNNNQKYRANHSLYFAGNQYRFLRYNVDLKGKRRFFLDSFEASAEIKKIMPYLDRWRTMAEIINFLRVEFEAYRIECEAFTGELIEKQLLLPELSPNITGNDYFDRLQELLKIGTPAGSALTETMEILEHLKVAPPSLVTQYIIESANKLRLLEANEFVRNPLSVNTQISDDSATLSTEDQLKIIEGLFSIDRLLPHQKLQSLSDFVSAFQQKFDQTWLPLLVALDPECGVGYEPFGESVDHSSLLKGMIPLRPREAENLMEWTPAHSLLLDKWFCLQRSAESVSVVHLRKEDLENLPVRESNLHCSPSISVLFRKIGDKVFIERAGGATATALLGRFTPFDEEINKAAHDIAQIEESANPEVVFAEIAHLSELAFGNVERRNTIRKYEIPILTASGVSEDNEIPLNDLWITVRDNKIILWSEKLQKRVIPRLTSAFNYQRSDLPVFRLLCDLQYQDIKANFNFDLSIFFPNLSFYPRVQYGQAVLSLASWHITKEEVGNVTTNESERIPLWTIKEFARKKKWPRYISCNRDDHYIVIDTENEEELLLLVKILKKGEKNIIREFPFIVEREQLTEDPAQRRSIRQYIAHLYHRKRIYDAGTSIGFTHPEKSAERKFIPGSQWFYFKIYCHPSRSNELLLHEIAPVCNNCKNERRIKQWFFVRYFDLAHHLRVRLNMQPSQSGCIIRKFHEKLAPLVKNGLISHFQTDIYDRELERYDESIIELVEKSFCESSHLVTIFLKNTGNGGEFDLYEVAFCSLNVLFDAFEYSEGRKISLLKQLFENMEFEFGQSTLLKSQLREKFREILKTKGIMNRTEIIRKFCIKPQVLRFKRIHRLIAHETRFWSSNREMKLIADLIHMHLNRLLSIQQRKQELVIYYCLWRYLESEIARIKS